MSCEPTWVTDFHIHQELLSEAYGNVNANFPYKKLLKATAIEEPSEFDYSLTAFGDNYDFAAPSERCYFDAFPLHIYDLFHQLKFILHLDLRNCELTICSYFGVWYGNYTTITVSLNSTALFRHYELSSKAWLLIPDMIY